MDEACRVGAVYSIVFNMSEGAHLGHDCVICTEYLNATKENIRGLVQLVMTRFDFGLF